MLTVQQIAERAGIEPAEVREAVLTEDEPVPERIAARMLGWSVSKLQKRRVKGLPPAFDRQGSRILYKPSVLRPLSRQFRSTTEADEAVS